MRSFTDAQVAPVPAIPASGMLPPAETRWATEKREENVARRRWQNGSVFQRGKNWVARYREDVVAPDGTRRRRHRGMVLGAVNNLNKRQARRLLMQRLAGINQGTHKPEVMITFEQFVLEYWEPNVLSMLRHGTVRNYQQVIRTHLLAFFGQIPLPDIRRIDVQQFLAAKAKKLAPRTVLSLRNRLSKIFGDAQVWGYITDNPARGTKVPSLEDTRERLALTAQQVCALLRELVEPYRTMVLLAVLSGLRRGEIFGLRWKYVDFESGVITVAESNYLGQSGPPKTRASRRVVYVDQTVLDALRGVRPEDYQPDGLVFPSAQGTALNPSNVWNRVLAPACDRAGIPRINWHNFRYTYATLAAATGESIKAVQAQLGHTDSKLTLSVYTQPMPEQQRQVATKVAGVLNKVLFPNVPTSALAEMRAGNAVN